MGKRNHGQDIIDRVDCITNQLIQACSHGISVVEKTEENIEDMEMFALLLHDKQAYNDTKQALYRFTTLELSRIRRNYNALIEKA